MTDYIHQTNDVIDIAAGALPTAWKNVSGLNMASAAELKTLGWLPVTYVNETFNAETQIRSGPTGVSVGDAVAADADSVTGTYTITDRVPDTDAAIAASRLKTENAELNKQIALVTDAPTKAALTIIAKKLGATS